MSTSIGALKGVRPLIVVSKSDDPWLNLALENYLLRSEERHPILLLYINRPALVLGRFQNPWLEIALDKLSGPVDIVRRQSGGGTVYHDFGNLNYCLIHDGRDFRQCQNQKMIGRALETFGVSITVGSRGDLYVEAKGGTRKISGSAFKQIKDRSFHHGTLLVNADLAGLNGALRARELAITTRAVRSNPHPVVNLQEHCPAIDMESLVRSLKKSFVESFDGAQELALDQAHILSLNGVCEYYESIQDKKWNFHETPDFQLSFSFESRMASLSVKKGVIVEIDDSTLQSYLEREFQIFYEEILVGNTASA